MHQVAGQLGHFAALERCLDTFLDCEVDTSETSGSVATGAVVSSRGRVEVNVGSEMELFNDPVRVELEGIFLLELAPQLPLDSQGRGGDLHAGASGNPGGRGDHAGLGLLLVAQRSSNPITWRLAQCKTNLDLEVSAKRTAPSTD